MNSDLLHFGYILSLWMKSNGVDMYPLRQWGKDKVWSQNRNRHQGTNDVKRSLVSTYVGKKVGKKTWGLFWVFQCLLTVHCFAQKFDAIYNLLLLRVLQMLLSNKISMNSENIIVEEYSFIELYLLLPRSAGPFCPNFIVLHINPL